MNRYHR
ncbi:hypothetical protein E2C01_094506 [Portunus trituberculatus]|nr:hypothetical protein [Portunus trituberculatus]